MNERAMISKYKDNSVKLNTVVVLLGSNIDKEINLPKAIFLLKNYCNIIAISSIYETLPVGCVSQDNFFNAAVQFETELDVYGVKDEIISSIEKKLDRVRLNDKNAPRTIDIDIVLFNNEVLEYDNHHIPSPDLLEYAHVIVPIAEIIPDLRHPETGQTFRSIADTFAKSASQASSSQSNIWKRHDVTFD